MSLIIADRVKETTTTQGIGTVTLSGATFGGFQSFSSAIGEGNTTYYCIQNESNFEIGIGTFSSGTLSRDTVIKSSSSGSKISITGVAIVFCVIPADKLLYKDESGNLTTTGDLLIDDLTVDYILANSGDFNGPVSTHSLSSTDIFAGSISTNGDLGVSGLLTLRRESAGNFFHAYIDDSTDRTISLYSDGISPIWKLGLKNSPSSETVAPSYGYVSAGDSYLALVGSDDNKITLSNTAPFCVTHQGINVINAHYMTGIHLNSISSSFPALMVNGGVSLSANIQEWNTYSGTTLSVVDSDGNFGVRNSNPTYQLDVSGTGNFSQAIRFGDGSIQTTAALPFASGQLIDQNSQNIITQSGYFQSYVSQSSGVLQSQIDQNTSNTSATSGYFESRVDSLNSSVLADSGYFESRLDSTDSTLSSTSGYFESRVDSSDSSITANSGYFESRVDSADSSITANSGYFESRVGSTDSSITANSGYFESRVDSANSDINTVSGLLTPSGQSFDFSANVLTYNNSDGGSFTADLSSLSTFDTSGVSLGYSAGTLTYTNNAGGTFDVDLSSISGDVYAMIVDGAPSTLDTLNEIAAALNDDANIATTLTSLISTTSGNLQTQITSNDSDIATVSGIAAKTFTVTASSSTNYTFDGMGLSSAADPTIYLHKGHTYYFDKQTSSHPFRISASDGGSVYQDADGSNIEITGQGLLTFEVPQNAPDKLYYYCTAHPSSMKGIIYTTADGSISGYFESRSDTADSNNIATSGYFESRSNQSNTDTSTVSGLLYNYWTVSDGTNSENILANQQVKFSGVGGSVVSYDSGSNTVSISGASDPTGVVSGVGFFGNDGILTGNNTFIYDGSDISLNGNITASGKRVITSDEIYHIEQVTQAEYDAITPNSATFYVITDAPSISGYFESRVDQSDLDIATVSGLLDSVNPTGTPSGISFFDNSGSLSGNNSLIYDGQDIKVSGAIFASGERVITSDEIFHIKQLTQSEYDSLTPESATFYIITDAADQGVIQPIKTVNSDYTILTTDYTIHTTAGLTLTLPTANGNGGITYNVKNVSTGSVSVNTAGSETIDGQSSFLLSTQYQSISLQSTNSNWIIV